MVETLTAHCLDNKEVIKWSLQTSQVYAQKVTYCCNAFYCSGSNNIIVKQISMRIEFSICMYLDLQRMSEYCFVLVNTVTTQVLLHGKYMQLCD